jgi:DNA-binding MarR family transcriptional regulator
MVTNPPPEPWTTEQLLSMAARLVQRHQDAALTALGLTHAGVIALQGLEAGTLNQEQLATRIGVQAQTLGKVLARLDAAGFITRTRDPRDRRSLDVALSGAGRAALKRARELEGNLLPADVIRRARLDRDLAWIISSFGTTPTAPNLEPPGQTGPSCDAN